MWHTSALPDALARAFAAPTTVRVSEFAVARVFLSEKQSPGHAGPYKIALAPYGVGMMDSWLDPDWDEEHWIKSAQAGVTEIALNIVRFIIAHTPTNIAYAVESDAEVRKISRVRLIETLRSIPEIAARLPSNDDDLAAGFLNLRDMVVHFLGSHATGAFENKALGAIFLDELAKHLAKPGSPNTVNLARERFKTLGKGRRKLYTLTKPGEQRGIEYREYMTGTRCKFKLPCPHCGSRQELVFEQLRYEHCRREDGSYDLERVLAETWYECSAQGCRIEHWRKLGMMLAAVELPGYGWERTNFDTGEFAPHPRKRSRHISDLYSMFCTWGELACEWIKAGDDTSAQAAFRIGRLGLWPELQSGSIAEQALRRLTRPLGLLPYRRGTLPFVPWLVSLQCDVQDTYIKFVVGAFNAAGDWFLVDYGMATDFGKLLADVAEKPVALPEGQTQLPQALVIDEGDGKRTDEIRAFVAAADDRFLYGAYTTKGARSKETKNPVWRTDVVLPGGEKKPAYFFRDFLIKRQFYITRMKRLIELLGKHDRGALDEEEREQLNRLPKIWLPVDATEPLFRELSAERLAIVNDREVFLDPETRNDWGDASKQALVIWFMLRPAS
ncbi:MAG: phage terminase large subunit family protein [Verrucomicrobia bacterium]|nr:phage terminase large subunit family protein [Verrucomicrobiota bacterium]